jgi:hypothetical protein
MCQFTFPITSTAESLVNRAQRAIEGAGGSFTGNSTEGNFKAQTPLGSIEGSYKVEGQQILLSVTKKPFLLSCSRIEKELSSVMR